MPTLNDIAKGLGIDPRLVSRYARRGMPTDSVAAAAAWRVAKIRPRAGGQLANQAAAHLSRLNALWPAARAALAAGSFHTIEGDLRAALRAVPSEVRPQMLLDVEVMDALCATFTAACAASGAASPNSSEGDLVPGRVWYAIAAGERLPADWLEQIPL